MKLGKYSFKLSDKEMELIDKNLKAFENNFQELIIEKTGRKNDSNYVVYTSDEAYQNNEYVQHCYNIDYLNGWLYGAVQAANGRFQLRDKKGD